MGAPTRCAAQEPRHAGPRVRPYDIIRRAQKSAGPTWGRLSADGQLIETKAILCDDMLTDRAGAGLDWWIAVQRAVLNIILPD